VNNFGEIAFRRFHFLVISPAEVASLSGQSQLFASATPKLISEWRTDDMYWPQNIFMTC